MEPADDPGTGVAVPPEPDPTPNTAHTAASHDPGADAASGPAVSAIRVAVGEETSRQANRRDWDRYADEYQSTHGAFLGDAGFVWGPEGLTEDVAGLLGDVTGKRVLELGCGAVIPAQWGRRRGVEGMPPAHDGRAEDRGFVGYLEAAPARRAAAVRRPLREHVPHLFAHLL